MGCDEFLMIVPRRQEYFQSEISLNSLSKFVGNVAFLGCLPIKNEALFERVVKEGKPKEILGEVTFNAKNWIQSIKFV